ncbi:hypothetical protein FC56_GL000955 [Lentilactobacillus senioris DSM 24302 = JCM 17472]|uniref:Type I restriction modification DNA specificity domain-containing protein n=1 Tax=Lentilactobacillus senioris DSM 24302 = JCM 17472 TaxID=1423802 RepID=A0A0R2CZ30_9LACO|nr:restriction endonuclease subunit S [Lentilactobacillus senioris]KRM93289.1 hypothetical protein FC56_GL000955 [Lentilactobacillus senioris DSM 24302 = JCM 17472]
MDEKMTPRIRFKGFKDDWERRKTKELCDISTGKGNTQDKVEDGKYPFYVRSVTIERSNEYLYDQEAVLTVGDGVGTGKVFHYVNGKYNLHQRVYRMFNFNHGVSAKYFYHYFSKNFYRRVMSMTAKTSVDSVRMEMIADMKIKFPSPAEQETIVSVLDGLDGTITLHQKKLDNLQMLKKLLMQKIFDQEWRFKGFTDPWEQRKLTDVGDIARGKSKHRPRNDKKLFGGKYPFVQTGDVASAGLFLTNYSQTYNDFGLAQSKLWPSGTLLITIAANIAETSILGIDAAFPDSVIGFTAKNSDVVFIKTLIDKFSNGLKRKAETSSQANLNLAKLSDLDIVVPNYDEQKQISSFFQNLDNLIASNQQHLDQLKTLKKYLMQNMFV